MKIQTRTLICIFIATALSTLDAGCVNTSSAQRHTESGALAPTPAPAAAAALRDAAETLRKCPTSAAVPIARYVGPYLGVENNLTAADVAQDWACADAFKDHYYPNGFVTIFGSSRIIEHNTKGDPAINAANDALYQQIRAFAKHWTERYGTSYPILSGAGPGIMEAAGRGAREAGKSIGYTTYYDRVAGATPDPNRFYGGDPTKAFAKYQGQDILTDGLIFSSIAVRESAMIRHSAAILIAPGGTGTEWETFQILETLKSHQLSGVPIYIVGDRTFHWASWDARLADMVLRTTLDKGAATAGVEFIDNPEDVIERLRVRLGLP